MTSAGRERAALEASSFLQDRPSWNWVLHVRSPPFLSSQCRGCRGAFTVQEESLRLLVKCGELEARARRMHRNMCPCRRLLWVYVGRCVHVCMCVRVSACTRVYALVCHRYGYVVHSCECVPCVCMCTRVLHVCAGVCLSFCVCTHVHT